MSEGTMIHVSGGLPRTQCSECKQNLEWEFDGPWGLKWTAYCCSKMYTLTVITVALTEEDFKEDC